MPAAWTPDPATPLHGASEASPINVNITYTVDTATDPTATPPTGYTAVWLSSAVPSLVTFTGSASGLLVAGPNLTGMSGQGIDYMQSGVSHHITRWEDLPPGDVDIYKLSPPTVNLVSAQFKVRANFAGGSFIEQIYTINATINYTTGRDRLVAEINLRR